MYKKTPDFTSSPRLPTNTSTQPNTDRVGALISSHPGDEVTPVGPGKTSTVHGCLVRQEGYGWPQQNHAAVSEKHLHPRANAVKFLPLKKGKQGVRRFNVLKKG